ncbi:MAG TPA: protein phosphatase 2C domain-containing protein [Longimicrobiaceae bacterium]|nr:protein phosphatase 2C domain-containing protein [Longimicrobiaceae bacterium]
MTIGWVAAGASHVGRVRKGNEDTFRADAEAGIFVVADGMGGHAAGETASRLAADAARQALIDRSSSDSADARLRHAFEAAHRRIVECCEGDPDTAGMGTTLTAAVLQRDGSLHIGHIGDSRMYHLRGELLRQLTHDHTWVQRELDGGRLKPEDARLHPLSHILSRVLSSDEPDTPDVSTATVQPGDLLLLCTDGLHNLLDAQALLAVLMQPTDPADTCKRLIAAANRGGGHDNVTAIVVRILPEPEPGAG